MPASRHSSAVTSPARPRVARKAKASGTPAKFEATPASVSDAGRTQRGSAPPRNASATASPPAAPSTAEPALMTMLTRNASMTDGVNR